ncbi:MAG: hypothetical protein QOJ09_1546 [Actinomycetota bacterium]|nr:hypothetical protein [Actinomycetota bacterium]
MRRPLAAAALCAALIVLAACQSSQDPALDSGGSTTTTAAADGSGGSTTTVASGFGVSEVSVPPAKKGLLTAVRAAHQGGFDRVVFEFEGAVPGYGVKYVDRPVIEDGSGKTVDVQGDSVLQVRMEPAAGADLAGAKLRQTYTGPNRIAPGTPAVTELVRTGDFEAVLTWVIGLKGRPGFRVNTLTGPPRLVIEVAAP